LLDGITAGLSREDAVRNAREEYDNFTESWIKECQRILKPTRTIWIMGMYHNIFRVGKIMQDLGLWFLNDVIWVKIDAMPNFNGRRFTNNHETLIWAVKNKNCKSYTFNNEFLKQMNNGEQMKDTDWVFKICRGQERLKDENGIKAHPTQKPLKLIQHVLLSASNKGDLVFVVKPSNIRIGDIVIFEPGPIIHRVIKINEDGTYETKGDNNAHQLEVEHSIPKSRIHGKVLFAVPLLGYPRLALYAIGI